MDEKIDIVILWVDGEADDFKKIYEKEIKRMRSRGLALHDHKARHRDNGELLFLLRSINDNIDWFNKIYIVTNGQIPQYIDFSNTKVRAVYHQDLFPEPDDAPSFNTFAIESVIHRIPGLSERFVRFSDDFFIGRELRLEDIAGSSGDGKFMFGGRFFNMRNTPYHRTLQKNAVRFWEKFGYLPLLNTLHVPQLRLKSYQEQMINTWEDWFVETRRSKFRRCDNAISLFLYPYFVLAKYRKANYAEFVVDIFRNRENGERLYKQINVGQGDWELKVRGLKDLKPMFFNLNDNMSERNAGAVLSRLSKELHQIFPNPSPFERRISLMPPLFTGQAV